MKDSLGVLDEYLRDSLGNMAVPSKNHPDLRDEVAEYMIPIIRGLCDAAERRLDDECECECSSTEGKEQSVNMDDDDACDCTRRPCECASCS